MSASICALAKGSLSSDGRVASRLRLPLEGGKLQCNDVCNYAHSIVSVQRRPTHAIDPKIHSTNLHWQGFDVSRTPIFLFEAS